MWSVFYFIEGFLNVSICDVFGYRLFNFLREGFFNFFMRIICVAVSVLGVEGKEVDGFIFM